MEAPIAAPLPPQSLPAPPPPNTSQPPHSSSVKTTQPPNRFPMQRIVPEYPTTPLQSSTNLVQDTWLKAQASVPPAPDTLPVVQNFLQKAFETVQNSQTVPVANRTPAVPQSSPKIGTVLLQTPDRRIGAVLSPQISSSIPFQSSPAAGYNVQNARNPRAMTPDKTAQMESRTRTHTYFSNQYGSKYNSYHTGSRVGNVEYTTTFYNRSFQGNARQIPNTESPQTRHMLVAKRRQSPIAREEKAVETPQSQSHAAENTTQSPLQSKAHNSDKPSSAPPRTPTKSSPLGSPSKSAKELKSQGQSRMAQPQNTHLTQRGTSSPKSNPQSPKRSGNQNKAGAGGARANGDWRQAPRQVEFIDPKRRVLVSGFPPYTQQQDLYRVLSTFGECVVGRCRNRLAVVTFDSEGAARRAIRASDEICIYGDFVEIIAYTNDKHVDDLFRQFKKVILNRKGDDIIQPNKIDLSGDFHQQLENILNAIRLTREEVQGITNLYRDLEMVLREEWPGCVAVPFGSIPTGLGIKSSDADCYVELPAECRPRNCATTFVHRARKILALYPEVFAQLVSIPRANTPILKFLHLPSGVHCDLSSKTPLGARNSRLIKQLLEHDPRLPPLAVTLKYWARVHALSGTGRLTNYALTMLLVFYLQTEARLLPSVERLQADRVYLVDHWNAALADRPLPPRVPNPAPVLELLAGFFRFYAAFDFDALVVCPYLGEPVKKAQFDAPDTLPPQFGRYLANVRENRASPIRYGSPFCVQDPFEQSHNVASAVTARLAQDVRAYFKYAAEAFAADETPGRDNFLRTVLMSRPKLGRDQRNPPATRIVLLPRIRADIPEVEWRRRVRDIILGDIFGKILQIPLEREPKREETEVPQKEQRSGEPDEAGRVAGGDKEKGAPLDREKYTAVARKAVWRRKKNYTVASAEPAASLVSRQLRATEQILATAGELALRFHLELGFRDQPRYFCVDAKFVDGDLDSFRGLVSFIHTAMFDWFRMILRSHLDPDEEAAPRASADQLTAALHAVALTDPSEDSLNLGDPPGPRTEDSPGPRTENSPSPGTENPPDSSTENLVVSVPIL